MMMIVLRNHVVGAVFHISMKTETHKKNFIIKKNKRSNWSQAIKKNYNSNKEHKIII